jgi:hypothetical protein
MSFFVTERQFFTASNRFDNPYDCTVPDAMDICETNARELSAAEPGFAPHIGFPKNGCTDGMEAFASPICINRR